MKTFKNKLFLSLVIAFVMAVSAFAVIGFSGNAKNASAETYEFDANAKISITDISGTPSDTLTFEYKFEATARTVQFCLRAGNPVIVDYFTLKGTGTLEANTTTEGVTISVTSAADDYYKVTIVGEGIVSATTRLYSNNGAYKSAISIRNLCFYTPVIPIEMVEGASVRLSEPYGIRFRANLSEAAATDEDATFGMAIIPYGWLEEYAELIETANGDYIAALNAAGVTYRRFDCTPVHEGDDYYIQASLTNVKAANLEKEFIGIAWMEKEGEKTYAFNENCARSIKTVAKSALFAENDGGYEETYTEEQRDFLFGFDNRYSLTDTSKSLAISGFSAIKGEQVIEFYYRKNSDGRIRFCVMSGWSDFFGYYSIYNPNLSYNAGVQVMPMGEGWSYDGDGTDLLTEGQRLWYRVVIDPSILVTVGGGNPASKTEFNILNFNGCTATFDIIGVHVRAKTVEDSAYYIMGKDSASARSYNDFGGLDLTGKTKLEFYIKNSSQKGQKSGQSYVRMYIEFTDGENTTNTGYVCYGMPGVDGVSVAGTAVTEGEYAGWYKCTVSIADKTGMTRFYIRYNKGEYFVGGFTAS